MRGEQMAGKRLNKSAPLTAAEKQARHRQKIAEEKRTAVDEQTAGLRAFFHSYLDQLSDDEFTDLFYAAMNGGEKLMSKKEICDLMNLSDYEWKKLERNKAVEPAGDNSSLFTGKELLRLQEIGITPDQMIRLCHCTDKSFTNKELSAFTGIPIKTLEKMFPAA
jgi:hypothetical protein